MNVMVFDIETIPDLESGRVLYGLDGLSDKDTAKSMFAIREQATGRDFLAHPLHKIAAISIVLANNKGVKVWSLGSESDSEKEIVKRFFSGLERYTPTLVSWNGGGFDLPVLNYRALKLAVPAPKYWDVGDCDRNFRYNNYLGRFHWRHLDLMDVISGYQGRATASLDMIATMLGFPGKLGMDGSKVWQTWLDGGIKQIRDYCETDVLNTYLVYLRFELIRGNKSPEQYQQSIDQLRTMLGESSEDHLQEFLQAWDTTSAEIT